MVPDHSISDIDTTSAVPDDTERMFHEIFPDEGDFSLEYVRSRCPVNGTIRIQVIRSSGTVAGFSTLLEYGGTLYILFLGIREAFRGKGIATSYLESLVHDNSEKTLLIDCHDELISFYSRFGFLETGYRLEYEGEWFEIITRGMMNVSDTVECMKWIGTHLHTDSGLFNQSGTCVLEPEPKVQPK